MLVLISSSLELRLGPFKFYRERRIMNSSTNVQAPLNAVIFDFVRRSQTGSMLSFVFSRSDCHLTI